MQKMSPIHMSSLIVLLSLWMFLSLLASFLCITELLLEGRSLPPLPTAPLLFLLLCPLWLFCCWAWRTTELAWRWRTRCWRRTLRVLSKELNVEILRAHFNRLKHAWPHSKFSFSTRCSIKMATTVVDNDWDLIHIHLYFTFVEPYRGNTSCNYLKVHPDFIMVIKSKWNYHVLHSVKLSCFAFCEVLHI